MSDEENARSITLGIASVGDLMIENKVTQSSVGDSLTVNSLSIPEYQRPYKWTDENALRLFDDIVGAMEANVCQYRVGTLILYDKGSKHEIVDGQQRTITFALLLKACGESVDFADHEIPDSPDTRRNVKRNYSALKRRIDGLSEGLRNDLLKYVEESCEFVVVITDDLPEAFQFFDSQNARGKKLYPHDLLKAYHLREMGDLSATETEEIVKSWEDLDQTELAHFFADYLYCAKRWMRGVKAGSFTEHTIAMFKGVSARNSYPYAQFYKGAYAYANDLNGSLVPFVTGMRSLRPFQLHTPIIAGKPFFEFASYYFAILKDIQDNRKYEGYFINDNDIVKTLEKNFNLRKGDRITRRLFDIAVLLYVDRFCPDRPEAPDLELFDRFVNQAFAWAYSLRAQYRNLGWASAQNYIMGSSGIRNSFNMYKAITEADDPRILLATLSTKMQKVPYDVVKDTRNRPNKENLAELEAFLENGESDAAENMEEFQDEGVYKHYLHHFVKLRYLELKE
ncbi:MAG: DUF262 domain-containing protein [Eggerthellaceae bacterium]|nr:DUF262 domain-containing protein [Eggerthellaceae bacterium]